MQTDWVMRCTPRKVLRTAQANTSPVSRGRAHAREAAGTQRPWPADKVERWAIDRLIPYAKNARTHTDAQGAAIAASIKEGGWTTPALVGEDGADRIGGLANLLLGSTKPRRCFSTHSSTASMRFMRSRPSSGRLAAITVANFARPSWRRLRPENAAHGRASQRPAPARGGRTRRQPCGSAAVARSGSTPIR